MQLPHMHLAKQLSLMHTLIVVYTHMGSIYVIEDLLHFIAWIVEMYHVDLLNNFLQYNNREISNILCVGE